MQSNKDYYNLHNIELDSMRIPFSLCKRDPDGIEEPYCCYQCKNIATNPKPCKTCNVFICSNCDQHNSLTGNMNCPSCGKIFKERELMKVEISIKHKIMLACPNTNKCKKEISLTNLLNHLYECAYTPRTATCKGCGLDVKTNNKLLEVEEHVNNCGEILIECDFCRQKIKRSNKDLHLSVCELQVIECPDCHTKVKKINIDKHDKKECISAYIAANEKRLCDMDKRVMTLEEILLQNNGANKIQNKSKITVHDITGEDELQEAKIEERVVTRNSKKFGQDSKNITKCIKTLDNAEGSIECLIHLQENQFVTATEEYIDIWKNDKIAKTLEGHKDSIHCIILLSTGSLLSGSSTELKQWRDNKCIKTIVDENNPFYCLAELADKCIASGSYNMIFIWRNFVCIKKLEHLDYVNSIIELKDKRLVSASHNKNILVWKNYECINDLKAHNDIVYALTELEDGRVVSACKKIIIWDSKFKKLVDLNGHVGYVYKVIELSDGYLASCSTDCNIMIWNGVNCVRILSGHTSAVNSIIQLPGGSIVSGSSDGTVKKWH
jgi:hypothetical protein